MNRRPTTRETIKLERPATPAHIRRDLRAIKRGLGRRRRMRLAVRALWMGLVVAAVGLSLRLVGIALIWPLIVGPAALTTLVALIYTWTANPSLAVLVRAYDRYFTLDELLATGLEVAQDIEKRKRPGGPVTDALLRQTHEATSALRQRVARHRLIPWGELHMLVAVLLIGLGLLLPGRWSGLPNVTPLAVPAVPVPWPEAASEAPQPTDEPVRNEEAEQPKGLPPEDQAAADAIADALRDGGPTRPAADALDQGDLEGAASELRDLGDQVDQLSPEAREDMAEALRDAADELRPTQPERARRLDQQADQLEAGPDDAATALDDLADMVDQLGGSGTQAADAGEQDGADGAGQGDEAGDENGGPPGAGGGAGEGLGGEQRGGSTTPPEPGGEVVPLPPGPDTDAPTTPATGPQGPTVQLDAGGNGSSGAALGLGAGSDIPLESEPDPLRIPPEYRDVVENYFSPPQ